MVRLHLKFQVMAKLSSVGKEIHFFPRGQIKKLLQKVAASLHRKQRPEKARALGGGGLMRESHVIDSAEAPHLLRTPFTSLTSVSTSSTSDK